VRGLHFQQYLAVAQATLPDLEMWYPPLVGGPGRVLSDLRRIRTRNASISI